MIDFSGTTFNKSIKTTQTRVLKDIPGLTNYRLSDKDIFELSIGKRVLSDEIVENGSIPIYSANVFEEFGRIDKQNITDFSVPSILWGIDGDWMVNIIPANKPFYPTDHCGVLRIKTDDIIPKYMALALQVEGEFERFSRSNRASTQRIANLVIQIPSVAAQQKVVDEIEVIDKKISDEQAIIREQSEMVKSKFVEMFGNKKYKIRPINEVFDLQLGKTPSRTEPKYWCTNNHKWVSVADMGRYDRFTSSTSEHISDEAVIDTGIKTVPKGTVIMSFKLTIGRTSITNEDIYTNEAIVAFLPKKVEYINNDYLRLYLSTYDWSSGQMNAVKGMTLNSTSIGEAALVIPPKSLQDIFANFVESCDKLKFEAQKRLGELNATREELIDKFEVQEFIKNHSKIYV